MTRTATFLGTVSVLLAFWGYVAEAQESEIDVVRELLLRLADIESRLEKLELQYDESAVPESGESGVTRQLGNLTAIEYGLRLRSSYNVSDPPSILFYVLYDKDVAGVGRAELPSKEIFAIDAEGLYFGWSDCDNIHFRMEIAGGDISSPLLVDVEVRGTLVLNKQIVFVPPLRAELIPGDPKELSIAPVLCSAWRKAVT